LWPESNQGATWSVIKYIEQDLPAAVDYVKSVTLAAKVHWVGHSMGGIILYSWLAFHMENSKDFASIVTLGSSLDHPRQLSDSQRLKLEAEQKSKAQAQSVGMTSAYHFLYGKSFSNLLEALSLMSSDLILKNFIPETLHHLSVPRSLRSPGQAPFAWANNMFSPLGGSIFDLFNGFQYKSPQASRPVRENFLQPADIRPEHTQLDPKLDFAAAAHQMLPPPPLSFPFPFLPGFPGGHQGAAGQQF
jgi:pimeloyl-ACP methyl ester carboxylesterase